MFVPLMYDLAKLPRHQGPITPSETTAHLRFAVNISGVRLITKRSLQVDPDQVIVHGYYDYDNDMCGEDHIFVSLAYNWNQLHICLDKLPWQRLCFDVAECVGHELVHRTQARRRDFKSGRQYKSQDLDTVLRKEQEYLGAADEIEAYGFSIAAEMAAMHGVFDADHLVKQDLDMYRVYSGTFIHDQSVILKLEKQISKYLRRLEADYYDQQNSKRSGTGRRARHTGRSSR
jgi:hypothetical protein